jgi:PAS domain
MTVENELRQSDNRLQSLFDSIDEGYCLCEMITVDGVPIDYRFLKVNPVFEEMTGLIDAVGKTAFELVPTLETTWIETYARPALQREAVRFEQGSDAMGRWFDVFATPVEPYGHFAIVFKDQTERRRREVALQSRSARYERAELMADMLSNMETILSLDHQTHSVINALVPGFADYASVEVPGLDNATLGAELPNGDPKVPFERLVGLDHITLAHKCLSQSMSAAQFEVHSLLDETIPIAPLLTTKT